MAEQWRAKVAKKSIAFLAFVLVLGCNKKAPEATFEYVQSCTECQVENVKYPNGQIQWEYQTKNGKKHGLAKGWWPSGKLSSEKYYKDGKMHGPQKIWDESGTQIGNSVWKDGEYAK